jgi:ankyrin repeat protein
MTAEGDLLGAIECHEVADLRALLDAGLDPRGLVRGKTPVQWLLEMYSRSDRFPACLRLLLERGGQLDAPWLEPVLLDDGAAVRTAAHADPSLLTRRADLVSAFTPLLGATALHVAAEYGHAGAARALLEAGAEGDARAATDQDGLGGQTPLFHTVNSNGNRSRPVLELLLAHGARTDVLLPGLCWGRGFEWETPCFDVTPISYAQLGLLPQFHRKEADIYDNTARLLRAAGRPAPALANVPNRYLQPRR